MPVPESPYRASHSPSRGRSYKRYQLRDWLLSERLSQWDRIDDDATGSEDQSWFLVASSGSSNDHRGAFLGIYPSAGSSLRNWRITDNSALSISRNRWNVVAQASWGPSASDLTGYCLTALASSVFTVQPVYQRHLKVERIRGCWINGGKHVLVVVINWLLISSPSWCIYLGAQVCRELLTRKMKQSEDSRRSSSCNQKYAFLCTVDQRTQLYFSFPSDVRGGYCVRRSEPWKFHFNFRRCESRGLDAAPLGCSGRSIDASSTGGWKEGVRTYPLEEAGSRLAGEGHLERVSLEFAEKFTAQNSPFEILKRPLMAFGHPHTETLIVDNDPKGSSL
ncbi:hypothetical protein WN48_02630 [Eufriesea mexicana]|uniref:Uncharacterized protein n=1 Tax=Eufriesea mexicana TaxID=516756 RepID=A0A310SGD2_9HYME|nr:hypothetical protein WN48_02630 [Eufriesea mexicana]